ncbi:uncharacterized protein EV420DRAFT_1544244 [Desarmillaria tabescens]|uniref:Uncharacterized protein n=1 Tax=Armillaria tabescens TaxID=1929756 RepID=A0AA39KE01_ARMTA|nr:uncharacterized protein EV420DRAFT_1544244 [Desarmillaria tabescens]KAK0458220.1 hypothetical protein EV420DRAFT_1544244 [Desarmillaria tabescens]
MKHLLDYLHQHLSPALMIGSDFLDRSPCRRYQEQWKVLGSAVRDGRCTMDCQSRCSSSGISGTMSFLPAEHRRPGHKYNSSTCYDNRISSSQGFVAWPVASVLSHHIELRRRGAVLRSVCRKRYIGEHHGVQKLGNTRLPSTCRPLYVESLACIRLSLVIVYR